VRGSEKKSTGSVRGRGGKEARVNGRRRYTKVYGKKKGSKLNYQSAAGGGKKRDGVKQEKTSCVGPS